MVRCQSEPRSPTRTRRASSATTAGATTSARSSCRHRSSRPAGTCWPAASRILRSATTPTSHGVRLTMLGAAHSYLLNQAEIGMTCALGTGGDMVVNLVRSFAPPDIRDRVMEKFASGEWAGQTIQSLTERTGGSDLAELETTATADGDAWRINGFKWFASNANGAAWVVLAKPEGAPDSARGIATFLVLTERRDGSRNGIHIRRLKDKLGTKAVASAEVEFVDAEAFLLSGQGTGEAGAGDGKGLARMMAMTNGARLGIAMMGLGCARRALVEAMCYARVARGVRQVAGRPAAHAAQDRGADRRRGGGPSAGVRRVRPGSPSAHRCSPHQAASGSPRHHRGERRHRGARWQRLRRELARREDPPRRAGQHAVGRPRQHPLSRCPARHRARAGGCRIPRPAPRARWTRAPAGDATTRLVTERIEQLSTAIERWKTLDRTTAEARLFPLAQFMVDVYAGALLVEQAGFEQRELGTDRKALVARLYAQRHLVDHGPLRGIDEPAMEELDRFKELWDGALVDSRTI